MIIKGLHVDFTGTHAAAGYPISFLVAWLAKVWESGSVRNAMRYVGGWSGWGNGYYRIYRLEKLLGDRVFVRAKRPFTLTATGESLIRRYYDEI